MAKKKKTKKRKRIGKPMSFRFTQAGLQRLRELAEDDHRSMASMLEKLISDAYNQKFEND